MHEFDLMCHFVMGLVTWAKQKLKENWVVSLLEAITKMKGFLNVGCGDKSFPNKEHKFQGKKALAMKGNANHELEVSKRKFLPRVLIPI